MPVSIETVPASTWAQYPVALILLIVIVFFWREYRNTIKEMNVSWQAFLKEQREGDKVQRKEDNQVVCDLVGEVKVLARGISDFRSDFDKHSAAEMVFLQQMQQTISQNKPEK